MCSPRLAARGRIALANMHQSGIAAILERDKSPFCSETRLFIGAYFGVEVPRHRACAREFRSRGWETLPRLVIEPESNGSYVIRFNGDPHVTYQLQRATSVTGPWTTNFTFTTTCFEPVIFHDTNAPLGQAFYRTAQQ
jgi:hypothetical protein